MASDVFMPIDEKERCEKVREFIIKYLVKAHKHDHHEDESTILKYDNLSPHKDDIRTCSH